MIFNKFIDNFSEFLSCKINVFHIFNVVDFLSFLFKSRSIEIMIESNFLLEMYVRYTLKDTLYVQSQPKVIFTKNFEYFLKKNEPSGRC